MRAPTDTGTQTASAITTLAATATGLLSPALSGPEEQGGRCGSCDCDPELLDPWLLAWWLRSLPYRHAEVFNQACSGRDTMRDHPWPGAWSASQYLVHVAWVAEVTAKGVVRLLADDPARDVTQEAPAGLRSRLLPATVMASIGVNIGELASTAELIASDDWLIGMRGPGELPALELIRHALHEATHHLVESAQVLEHLRLHPAGTSGDGAIGIAFSATVSDDGGRSRPRPARSTRRPTAPRYRSWQW